MHTPRLYAFADEASKEIDGQIRAMLRNGLKGLEIRGVDGVNVSKITLEKAKEVRQKLDDNGLVTWSIGSPIGKLKLDEDFHAHLDTFRHTLEVADILGAKNLRMFSFYMPKGEDPTPYRQQVMDQLGQLIEVGAPSGINLCHENEKGIYGDNAKRCLDILEAVPLLRAVFDPANFVQCGQDTLEAWDMLRTYVKYLHIKDSKLNGDIVPAGEGAGNIPFILNEYRTLGGFAVTMEPHLAEFVGLGALEREGEKSQVGGQKYADLNEAFDAGVNALKALL